MEQAPRHLHVDLEFEVGSEPIRGRLGPGPRELREFHGWIELAAVLETLIRSRAEKPAPAAEPR